MRLLYNWLPARYPYFENYYKIIVLDLSNDKQQVKTAIQQVNCTENLDGNGNKTMSFIIEKAEETTSDFSQGILRVL